MSYRKYKTIDQEIDANIEAYELHLEMQQHALDFIDTYTNQEIAQMVREGILTIEEVESGLRRRIYA